MSVNRAISSKADLRTAVLATRDALAHEYRVRSAQAIAERGLPFAIESGCVVSGYSPIRSEISPLPLMQRLAAKGARLALPVIVTRDKPLEFRTWSVGEKLQRGPFGIAQPTAQSTAILPDVVLMPLAAFDRSGHRIGYGAGYYDRTLRRLRELKRIEAIGVAFAVQEVEKIDTLPHDAALDYAITEAQTFDFANPRRE